MPINFGVNGEPHGSSQATQLVTSGDKHSPQVVADTFVDQYYGILKRCPENTYKFYKDESTLSRPRTDGSMRLVKTMKEIDVEIIGSDIEDWEVHLLSVHGQSTLEESVFTGVVGYLKKDNLLKFFSQTFLLVPQTKGFYVHNDIFQFIDISSLIDLNHTANQLVGKDECKSSDDINQISTVNSSYANNSVVSDESNKINASLIHQSVSTENPKKVTYASILSKGNSIPSPAASCIKPTPPPMAPNNEAAPEVLKKDQDEKSISTEEIQMEKNSSPNAQIDANKESYASIVTKSIPSKPQAVPRIGSDCKSCDGGASGGIGNNDGGSNLSV